MIHREEFYLQLLQEKDTEYNALVKNLKDRVSILFFVNYIRISFITSCIQMYNNLICVKVIQLEQELLETQRKAGLPTVLPYDSTILRPLTPQFSRRPQVNDLNLNSF